MINLFRPNSSNAVKSGLRLALINTVLLLAAGIVITAIFFIVSVINGLGFPFPQPLALILILFGIPYYVFFYSYGKQYGRLIKDRPFIRGLTVGMLGQLPGMILRFAANNLLQTGLMEWEKLISIFNIFITVFVIALPLMCALGAMDKEQTNIKKTKSL